MPVRNLRDGVIKIQVADDGTSSAGEVEVTLEEGNLSWAERRPVAMISDRGTLDHARRTPQDELVEVSFTMMFQTFQDPNSASVTPYEALTQSGAAAAWVSQNFAQSDAYSVNLEFTIDDPEGGTDEEINFDYFHPTTPAEFTEGEEFSTLTITGEAPLYWIDFWWKPEDGINPRIGQIGTFTRASPAAATYIGKDGVVQTALVGQLRSAHSEGLNGPRTGLLEAQRTNLCLQSEDFGTTWATIGTPTRTPAAHTASGITLDLIGDDDAGAAEGYSQVVTFTGDAVKSISVFLKEGTSPSAGGSEIFVRDTIAAADRLQATVTWSAGVPSIVMTTGTEIESPVLHAGGVYRAMLATTAVTAANTNQIEVYPGRKGTVADTGNVYAGGVQAEDALFPASYIATTVATVTRLADVLFFPLPLSISTPQVETVFTKAIERGTALSVNGTVVFHIGLTSPTADPRLLVDIDSNGFYRITHDNGTTVPEASLAAAPSIGDLEELRPVLAADGSVTIGQSINGATETTAADATTATLQAAWAGERLYINSAPDGSRAGFNAFLEIMLARRTRTLADLRKIS